MRRLFVGKKTTNPTLSVSNRCMLKYVREVCVCVCVYRWWTLPSSQTFPVEVWQRIEFHFTPSHTSLGHTHTHTHTHTNLRHTCKLCLFFSINFIQQWSVLCFPLVLPLQVQCLAHGHLTGHWESQVTSAACFKKWWAAHQMSQICCF